MSALAEVDCSSLLFGEVADSHLVQQRSLAQAFSLSSSSLTCSFGGCCLGPAPAEVADSGLLQKRLLAQTCSHICPWLWPIPTDVPGSGLLPWRSLSHAWSHREVSGSGAYFLKEHKNACILCDFCAHCFW